MEENEREPEQKPVNISSGPGDAGERIPANTSAGQPPEPIIIPQDPNPASQTEIMEVHHPHLPHGKRNFKEYFLEFIMIFLAVTLGFLAETIREHYVEHQRVHQYAVLLSQDIKKNTVQATNELERRRTMQTSFDTLKNLILKDQLDSNAQIVKHAVLLSEILPLGVTTATFDQMKNSGSLRYIQNIQLIGSLTDYFSTLIPLTQTDIEQEFQLVKDNNQKFLREHMNLLQIDTADNLLTVRPDIYDWNKRTAIELYNVIVNTNIWNQWIMEKDLLPIQQKGEALIRDLKEEYDLE